MQTLNPFLKKVYFLKIDFSLNILPTMLFNFFSIWHLVLIFMDLIAYFS